MPNYTNAPITEALIDLQVILPKLDPESLKNISTKLGSNYPHIQARKHFQLKIGPDAPVEQNEGTIDGFLFRSSDEKYVVQSRINGFTLSRLKPYEKWDLFIEEFKKTWTYYKEIANPLSITRIAVRYINTIEIPKLSFDLEEYFTSPPEIPEKLPQTMHDFLHRTTLVYPENVKAIITVASAVSIKPGSTAIILDIDVFKDIVIDQESNDLFVILESLRTIKDEVFENYLTESTKKGFL